MVRTVLVTAVLWAVCGVTAGEPKVELSREFSDPQLGVAFTLPQGFSRLTDAEYRDVLGTISEQMGKDASERIARSAPVYFAGPKGEGGVPPPSMLVSVSGLQEAIDTARVGEYTQRIEQSLKKGGVQHGPLAVKIIKVKDLNALRVDYEIFSATDKPQSLTMLLIPSGDRRCDVTFNYSREQQPVIDSAIGTVSSTFRFFENATPAPGGRDWKRILTITAAAFAGGILLSYALRILSGATDRDEGGTAEK